MKKSSERGLLWDRRWQRRIVTIPVVVVAWVVITALSPLMAVIAFIVDLSTRRTDIPTVRLVALAVAYLTHEIIGLVAAIPVWLLGGIGANRRLGPDQAMQRWVVRSLLTWARRIMRVHLQLPDDAEMPDGEVVVLSRHASMVDAVLPGFVFLELADRPVHYVLKKEMAKSPMFDIYGHRLNNHFVDRGGDTDRETRSITLMAARARPDSGIIIFPEGTYATADSRRRVRASLERRGDTEGLERADQLKTLLPPKTAGALALLRARNTGAVVVMGHAGLEGMAELSGLRSNLPARSPVAVQWWTHQLGDLPTSDDARATWLQEQWHLLDQWVSEQLASER